MPFFNQSNIAGALDANHIYYNISVQNNNSGTDENGNEVSTYGKELIYTFNEARAQPYLKNPSDYYLSVVRFTLQSPNLPVFIAQPILGQINYDKTIYAITMTDISGNEYQQNVIWFPDDTKAVKPPAGVPVTRDYISPAKPYYYCYSYQHFIDCINETFLQIWFNIAGEEANPDNVPYMYFDPNTKLFQLGGPLSLFRTKSDGTTFGVYNIYFNTALYNLFSSLPAKYVANTVTSTYKQLDYLMILSTGSDLPSSSPQPFINNTRINQLTGNTDVYAVQEYITLPIWSPITAIMFKTSILSSAPELMATPNIYENNTDININKQHADVLNILVDYYSPLTNGTEYKPYIYYEPTGEYKLTDLYGIQPVDTIDIQVYWRDNFGNLIPFYLGLGATSTIKILFRKKIFNSDKV